MRRSHRKFGIELEFECPWEHLKKHASKAIKEIYGPRKYYSKDDSFESITQTDKWHIKIDGIGSISELTTPISALNDLDKISNVIEILGTKDLNPTEDCGFHVHIDIPDIDPYQFLAGWITYEKSIMVCFPLDRRKCTYCSKIVDHPQLSKAYVAKILESKMNSSDHTDAISFSNYDDRKTIEIRVAEGTDDHVFVRNWIEFLLYFVDFIKKQNACLLVCNKCNSISFDDLIDELPMKKSVREFMIGRYKKFGKLPYWTH